LTAKDGQTATAKLTNKVTVDGYNLPVTRKRVGAIQQGKNVGWVLGVSIKQATSELLMRKEVRFDSNVRVMTYHHNNDPIIVSYDSGANGNYVSKEDRLKLKAGMQML
jgi:hypothetical protein